MEKMKEKKSYGKLERKYKRKLRRKFKKQLECGIRYRIKSESGDIALTLRSSRVSRQSSNNVTMGVPLFT